ncbi:DNA glycosylase [Periconia macrospinosa]|uniref:DNA glycosylase n=1 Tax=Periconia macrospinosa TaxID=97972 RepID=A0A2V1E699_9PLEO|nr:DNA glycosylase [Periconia macrospinosa]
MVRVTRSSATKAEVNNKPALPPADPVQLSSPPATPDSHKNRKSKATPTRQKQSVNSSKKLPVSTPKSNRKRSRAVKAEKEDEAEDDLPHNLGKIPEYNVDEADIKAEPPAKKSRKSATAKSFPPKESVDELVTKASTTTPRKAKNNGYGLTPGQTPYPNWPHPTAEECEEVTRLLSTVHGEVKPPKEIPAPSLNVSGCGEVPSVLDALIRTRLSAATSGTNSSRAFAGLVQTFGILKEGIGKGSVDWNKVRLADTKQVFEAIKSGGLADVKSKDIKKILQMVWEENQARRNELLSSGHASSSHQETPVQKSTEMQKADENVLSLDHLHTFSNDDAFNALTKYPGIGPKTASCVLLFCLQRPSFAVDTHVFRLCTWLGWVPPPGDPAGLPPGGKGKFAGPNRNSTYAHCEVRIPDHLKYPLHQLFIKHGKTCPRCRAITGKNSEGWEKGCVIDHLVKRTGVRKGTGVAGTSAGGKVARPKTTKKGKKGARNRDENDSALSSELSDLGSESEGEESSESEVDLED